jgi:hypothetical protein
MLILSVCWGVDAFTIMKIAAPQQHHNFGALRASLAGVDGARLREGGSVQAAASEDRVGLELGMGKVLK